jgi:hypothetical protein
VILFLYTLLCHYMHETWSWHAYRYALGFLWKIGCDTGRPSSPSLRCRRITLSCLSGLTSPPKTCRNTTSSRSLLSFPLYFFSQFSLRTYWRSLVFAPLPSKSCIYISRIVLWIFIDLLYSKLWIGCILAQCFDLLITRFVTGCNDGSSLSHMLWNWDRWHFK